MSYQALYRKYRPQTFLDVKGQEHIVKSMCNQVKNNRVGHAYLYCGTRGTGKTTVAKIMARAVNCENPVEGNPCGVCDTCKSILEGRSMCVIEIDAASNNGVDNVREIIEEVSYPPVDGKYKVYIIDEVHMLSRAAFNALLKTLEEPPAYAMFILATTDPQQIPITILSRCQRYDFRHISVETIADRMRELMTQEDTKVEDRAITYIALAADGSMRDGLSILDQCLAFHYGEELTYEMVLDVLGAVDTKVFSSLLRCVSKEDIIGAIEVLDQVVYSGRELPQFVNDFIWYLRNLMLAKSSEGEIGPEVLQMSLENYQALLEEAKSLELRTILRYIGVFSELSQTIKYSSQKRIMIEMTLIRLCKPQMDYDVDAVLERVRSLEKQVEEGAFLTPQVVSVENVTQKLPPKQLEVAVTEDIKHIVNHWDDVVEAMKTRSFTGAVQVKDLKVSMDDDGNLIVASKDTLTKQYFGEQGTLGQELKEALAEVVGKNVPYSFRPLKETEQFDHQYVDLREIKKLFPEKMIETDNSDDEDE